jgi:hypothetical protein
LNKVLGLEDGSAGDNYYSTKPNVPVTAKSETVTKPKTTVATASLDEDEDLSYFEKLAED